MCDPELVSSAIDYVLRKFGAINHSVGQSGGGHKYRQAEDEMKNYDCYKFSLCRLAVCDLSRLSV